jgi:hypothetical protein
MGEHKRRGEEIKGDGYKKRVGSRFWVMHETGSLPSGTVVVARDGRRYKDGSDGAWRRA